MELMGMVNGRLNGVLDDSSDDTSNADFDEVTSNTKGTVFGDIKPPAAPPYATVVERCEEEEEELVEGASEGYRGAESADKNEVGSSMSEVGGCATRDE